MLRAIDDAICNYTKIDSGDDDTALADCAEDVLDEQELISQGGSCALSSNLCQCCQCLPLPSLQVLARKSVEMTRANMGL